MRPIALLATILCAASPAAAQVQRPDPVWRDGFESGLILFVPGAGHVRASQAQADVSPSPAFVALSDIAPTDTFVTITSSAPARLQVPGGGVTVQGGTNYAFVPLASGAPGATPVTLSASQGGQTRTIGLRVEQAVNESGLAIEADYCNTQFPSSITAIAGTPLTTVYGRLFEAGVTAAAGAPAGWIGELGIGPVSSAPDSAPWTTFTAAYNLQVDNDDEFAADAVAPIEPGAYAYAFRFSPDGGANWTWCDLDGAGSNTGADLGGTLGSLTVTPVPLVINEVDYDQPGSDTQEFIELRNNSPFATDLARYTLVLVDGNDGTAHARFALAGVLAPGQHYVLASASVVVPPTALVRRFDGESSDRIQNGGPDGIALVDELSGMVIDALSYEGSIIAADIPLIGIVSLVEGSPLPVGTADSNTVPASLSRLPDGADTDDAASDWGLSSNPTPGAANQP
jgi:hypothetical protein